MLRALRRHAGPPILLLWSLPLLVTCGVSSAEKLCESAMERLECPEHSSAVYKIGGSDEGSGSLALEKDIVSGSVEVDAAGGGSSEVTCDIGCAWDEGYEALGDPATCSTTPCGGDPAGSWEYTSVCVEDTSFLEAACPGSFVTAFAEEVGTLDLDPTGSLTETLTSSRIAVTFVYDPSCTATESSCSIFQLGPNETCIGAPADGCSCTTVIEQDQPVTTTGSWAPAGGSRLRFQVPGNGSIDVDFCVDGDTLQLHRADLGTNETLSRL